MPIVGVNHCLPILNMPKRLVLIYTTEKSSHQFSIGYMINPSLHLKKYPKYRLKMLGLLFFYQDNENY